MSSHSEGTYPSKPVLETTEADFDKCISLNLRSIYHSVIACMPSLIAATKKGLPASMVNIASTGGVKGRPGLTWYSASKAGAINATQSLAHEFAAHQIVSEHSAPLLDTEIKPDPDCLTLARQLYLSRPRQDSDDVPIPRSGERGAISQHDPLKKIRGTLRYVGWLYLLVLSASLG